MIRNYNFNDIEESDKMNDKIENIFVENIKTLKEFDEEYRKVILGVDEAGRGPLAGPVVAGAVIIPKYFEELDEINDSKKLSEKKRNKLYNIIMEKCIVGVGVANEREIDDINILNATYLAMKRAIQEIKLKKLNIRYELTLVDGNHEIKGYNEPQKCVIKGDGKSLSIASASIIAKVTRDAMMKEIGSKYPVYQFEKHKGYGTKIHRESIIENGPCEHHRKSFLKNILKEEEMKIF